MPTGYYTCKKCNENIWISNKIGYSHVDRHVKKCEYFRKLLGIKCK